LPGRAARRAAGARPSQHTSPGPISPPKMSAIPRRGGGFPWTGPRGACRLRRGPGGQETERAMDEARWLEEAWHPQGMLWTLWEQGKVTRTKAGRRKLRLFACECCRLVWDLLPDPRLREAVEVADRFAEGQASKEALEAARRAAQDLGHWRGA